MHFGTNTTTRIPKLFLTAQTVNPPPFPLHVPNERIADKHLQEITLLLAKDFVHYFLRSRSGQVHSLMAALTCLRSTETNLTLTCPSPNHLFLISQILGDTCPAFSRVSRSVGRVGDNPGNEVVHRGASILNFILFFVVNTFFPYILFYKCTWSFLFICSLWLVFYFIVVTRILKYTPISIKFAPMNHVS